MPQGVYLTGTIWPRNNVELHLEYGSILKVSTNMDDYNGLDAYGMTDILGRMHGDAQFAGSSSVPAHVEMMGLIGAGNNPMVGMTVAVAVAIEEASK